MHGEEWERYRERGREREGGGERERERGEEEGGQRDLVSKCEKVQER